jgi:hypothetical protein
VTCFSSRSCYPTIASDNVYPDTREQLRSQLCLEHRHDPFCDIGIDASSLPCSQSEFANLTLCATCRLCEGKPYLSPAEQSMYKYQLIVDGQAATNDASVWKLLSNSAVIRVRPNSWDIPLFVQFYDPILQPYKHIIPSEVAELNKAIAWCEENDQQCKMMAKAARDIMKCLLQKEVIEQYIILVFMYIHDSVNVVDQLEPI